MPGYALTILVRPTASTSRVEAQLRSDVVHFCTEAWPSSSSKLYPAPSDRILHAAVGANEAVVEFWSTNYQHDYAGATRITRIGNRSLGSGKWVSATQVSGMVSDGCAGQYVSVEVTLAAQGPAGLVLVTILTSTMLCAQLTSEPEIVP